MSHIADEKFMGLALELACRGVYYTAPNPMVGAVLVAPNGDVIGRGWHHQCGGAHAEVNAIADCKDDTLLSGATMYVTLEPCSHYGKTPPCADLIIEKGIKKVVVACVDPFEKVAGRGIALLRNAGVDVKVGVMEREARQLNRRFFTFIERRRPYIVLKWAQSKDGAIDIVRSADTPPVWFTGAKARQIVHQWRAENQAILVGRVTAELDNPALTVRDVMGKNPLRLVVDRNLQLPQTLKIFTDEAAPTTIFADKSAALTQQYDSNVTVERLDFGQDIVPQILNYLYRNNIQSLFVEGGAMMLQSFIDAALWDEAAIFTAPKPIGAYYPNVAVSTVVAAPKIEGQIVSSELIEGVTLERRVPVVRMPC